MAILRAAAAGRVEMTCSCEPDLYVDGLACCDQTTGRLLAHAGLIRPARPGSLGQRVPVRLTAAGHAALQATPEAA
ncbi:hypothetical protein FPZ12_006800 [Amycolatopsis acidicola]|uniref:ArsR family transcriptional regulator n=2 Tax=Amycolatopsis acidicola TaxID=2596893 RepID=A0A5N0VFA9_9PSEU|nr:hypothetical protein FPZ12_006800 [Amycolatopsis acidicola]